MKLGGKWAMGPIAHIIIYAIIWHAVIEIWQKMREKMDKWMYKLWSPGKDGKVHSYHDTWLRALNIFCMKFSADPWPDLDIGQWS